MFLQKLKEFAKVNNLFLTIGALVVVVTVVGLFHSKTTMNPKAAPQQILIQTGADALELNVENVNSIIAREFNLPRVSGVLVNNIPLGTARRLSDIKRGDVIYKYNNIVVHDMHHLSYLMSQNHPGDTINFHLFRQGKMRTIAFKIPTSAGTIDINNPTVVNIIIAITILVITFSFLFFGLLDRTVCVVLGAALMMIFGSILGFYNQTKAFNSIMMSPILIYIGMSIFSLLLEEFKYFDYISKKMIIQMKAKPINVIFGLCVLTYLFSLAVNNLTTILVMIPITIAVCRTMNINPIGVITAEIISSNIGGASTMIGDFPNMLISSSTGLSFIEFLIFMMPICFILLLAMFWYLYSFELKNNIKKTNKLQSKKLLSITKKELQEIDIDWAPVKKIFMILLFVIAGFIILPIFRIQPATIALAGGFILLALEKDHSMKIIKKISFTDVLFFGGLFILVGGAVHSGLLLSISHALNGISAGNDLVYLLLLMWVSAIFTMFLNAGPSTVFFIPIVLHTQLTATSDITWWALSLGVLAGSSATILGATAGIVTQTMLDERSVQEKGAQERLTYLNYSSRGIPIALMFLVISSLYIVFLSSIPGLK